MNLIIKKNVNTIFFQFIPIFLYFPIFLTSPPAPYILYYVTSSATFRLAGFPTSLSATQKYVPLSSFFTL